MTGSLHIRIVVWELERMTAVRWQNKAREALYENQAILSAFTCRHSGGDA